MSPTLRTPIKRSAKTMQLEGMFDLGSVEESVVELRLFPTQEMAAKSWSVGLIVGPSGSGKTQTAKQVFADVWPEPFVWDDNAACIDELPCGIGESVETMSSVGFSSPPSWLRPYRLLSNGEQFRVEIARRLLDNQPVTVVDEFTSVVDRNVARVVSHAVQKLVRRQKQQFVAVTCHYDIEEWLQPDWVYDASSGVFLWRSLQRRPGIQLELVRGSVGDWPRFSRHHYLDGGINRSARVVVGLHESMPVVFCGVLPMPSGTVQNAWRVSRIVTLPDYQGIGLGPATLDAVGGGLKALGKVAYITTSHQGMMQSLNRSASWAITKKPGRSKRDGGTMNSQTRAISRNVAGAKYVGPARLEIKKLLVGGALQ